jgi:8-oxo-dGTP pyrophosphatase MutT (NUDIX family)
MVKPMRQIASVILLKPDGSALLQHRDDKPSINRPGAWVFPGGHREGAETMEECAKREFLEETAYRCDKIYFLHQFNDTMDDESPYELHIFWGIYDGVQPYKCLEGQDLKFLTQEKAKTLKVPPHLIPLWTIAIEAMGRIVANPVAN